MSIRKHGSAEDTVIAPEPAGDDNDQIAKEGMSRWQADDELELGKENLDADAGN